MSNETRFAAFESLVEKHRDSVYGFALRMTRSETEAMEIVQESFLSAYRHLGRLRNETDFRAWLHQTAASHALHRLRLVGRAPVADEMLTTPAFDERTLTQRFGDNWSHVVDEKVLDAELSRAIEEATDALPQGHRAVLLLKDVAGLGYQEIADTSRSSIPTIKWRLHRARLCLRATIDRFCREN